MVSTVRLTGAMGSKGSLPPPVGRRPLSASASGAWATWEPMTTAAARPVPPTRAERREMAVSAICWKVGFAEVLGTGWAHALPHLSSHVTAERLPRVWPAMGRRRFSMTGSFASWGWSGVRCRAGDDPGVRPAGAAITLAPRSERRATPRWPRVELFPAAGFRPVDML